MNPFDAVGTARISSAIYDRTCRIAMDYQSADDRVGDRRAALRPLPDDGWRAQVVDLVRRTREHQDVRIGSSVRGAIDLVAIATRLVRAAAVPAGDWHVGLDAALVVAVRPDPAARVVPRGRPEEVVRELYERVFGRASSGPTTDGGRPGGSLSPPPPAAGRPQQRSNPKADASRNRTVGRSTLARHARFAEVSPEVGVLDEQALDAGAVRRPGRHADDARRAGARHRRVRCAPRPGGWRRGSSSTAHGPAARPAPVRRDRGSVPADRGGDLDVDASMDAIVTARGERRPAGLDELTARDWGRPDLAVCLLVDASGSMSGERLAAAATVTAACALRAPAEHAVLAFAGDVRTLRTLHGPEPAATVVDRVLALRGHGVTRLADALRAASRELAVRAGAAPGRGAAVRLPAHRRGPGRRGPDGPGAGRARAPRRRGAGPRVRGGRRGPVRRARRGRQRSRPAPRPLVTRGSRRSTHGMPRANRPRHAQSRIRRLSRRDRLARRTGEAVTVATPWNQEDTMSHPIVPRRDPVERPRRDPVLLRRAVRLDLPRRGRLPRLHVRRDRRPGSAVHRDQPAPGRRGPRDLLRGRRRHGHRGRRHDPARRPRRAGPGRRSRACRSP